MLLVLDIGNTNMVVGVYEGEKLLTNWRMASDKRRSVDEYGILMQNLLHFHDIDPRDIKDVIISSVVPPIMGAVEEMSEKYFKITPIVVGPGVKSGMPILYENPREVGADRIVNAVAAYHKYGGPLIIVDFGTATTFCTVSDKGEYLGGAIMPGLNISAEALYTHTAKLPKVELVAPEKIIGKNTVAAMQGGIVYGYCGAVEGIIKRIKKECSHKNFKVVATGGLSSLIAKETNVIDVVDNMLTLEGLRIIHGLNSK